MRPPGTMAAGIAGFLSFLLLLGEGWAGDSSVTETCSDCRWGGGIDFLEGSDGVWFCVGEREVDIVLFCEAVELCAASGCYSNGSGGGSKWRRAREDLCPGAMPAPSSGAGVLDAAAVELSRLLGRKILHHFLENSSLSSARLGVAEQEGWPVNVDRIKVSPANMAVIAPPTLLICCIVLCPCFHIKRRGDLHESASTRVIDKVESIPSVLDKTALSERISSTQVCTQSNSHRVPASPRFSSSLPPSANGPLHLSLNQIARATQNFSPSNIIGEGGFGTVYKACLLDGQVVAVKRARKEQAVILKSEFRNEIQLLSKIEHRNLVRLLGYIETDNEKVIISEYVPNGNLRDHLDCQHGNILDFNQRLEIAIDVAHGLTYLHCYAERQIIHRDVKSSNILLTEGHRAKVANFGFARVGPANDDISHISTEVKGTVGYLDPEYMKTYQLTEKSDVFSFGILLLEILSGRGPVELTRTNNEKITVKWAFRKFEEGNMMDILDPMLDEVVDEKVLMKLFSLAFQCAAPVHADRPFMKKVAENLWVIRKEYQRSQRNK